MKILELFQDIAGKWRARVDIGGETVFFKFQEEPKQAIVLQLAQEFVDRRNTEKELEIAQQLKKQALEAKIQGFDETKASKTDATELVKSLIEDYQNKYGYTK